MILDLHKTAGYSFDPGEKQSGFLETKLFRNASTDYGKNLQSALADMEIKLHLNY